MALHLVKLAVGAETLQSLAAWQAERLQERAQRGEPPVLHHVTRMTPTRGSELLAGGSLYWVIRGDIRARQRLTALEPVVDKEGIRRCRLVLDKTLVATAPQPRRPFQGWRYLQAKDAPRDLGPVGEIDAALPEAMRDELAALGLL